MGEGIKVDLGTIDQAERFLRAMDISRRLLDIGDLLAAAVLSADDDRAYEAARDWAAIRTENQRQTDE